MQVIENQTRIEGRVTGSRPHSALADYEMVTILVEKSEAVEGLPDLVRVKPGELIEVAMRRSLLGSATKGALIRFRAKRTIDGIMCEPHPLPGDFSISS